MTLKIKDISFIVTVAVMAFFLFDGCQSRKKIVKQNKELIEYTDSTSYYKSRSGELMASNEALVITSANQVKGLEAKLKELRLKKPRTITQVSTVTEIKEVAVSVEIPCEDFEKNITIDSTNYTVDIRLTQDDLTLKSILIPNVQDIYVADLREKWWKKKELSVVVTNSNPIVKSVGITSYTIEPEKKFYRKRWFWASVGFAAGVFVTYKSNN